MSGTVSVTTVNLTSTAGPERRSRVDGSGPVLTAYLMSTILPVLTSPSAVIL
jgi:hypothetical protein